MVGARAGWKDLEAPWGTWKPPGQGPGAGVRRVNALHLPLWSWA